MRIVYLALVFVFCCLMMQPVAAQSQPEVNLLPKAIIENVLRLADRVDIVHDADAAVNWTYTDTAMISTLLNFMVFDYPGHDMGCTRIAKMYFSSSSDVILDVDIHYFGHSKCGYYVIRENDMPVYFAYMDLGGLAMCEQLVNHAGYPRK